MDTNNKLPPQSVEQLRAEIEELKITMAIKEEDAYRRGRNDCIRDYFAQMQNQPYSSSQLKCNQS